jgi:hypothetical protein
MWFATWCRTWKTSRWTSSRRSRRSTPTPRSCASFKTC